MSTDNPPTEERIHGDGNSLGSRDDEESSIGSGGGSGGENTEKPGSTGDEVPVAKKQRTMVKAEDKKSSTFDNVPAAKKQSTMGKAEDKKSSTFDAGGGGESTEEFRFVVEELQEVLSQEPFDEKFESCSFTLGGHGHAEVPVHSVMDRNGIEVLAGEFYEQANVTVQGLLDQLEMPEVCPDDTTGMIETLCITFDVKDLYATNIKVVITREDAFKSQIEDAFKSPIEGS